jgi:hypothetical protein
MKLILFSIIALFFSPHYSQDDPELIRRKYRQIVDLVKQDDAKALSKLVAYPIRRPNPLPDIATSEQFVAYYSTIFDAKFKRLLSQYDDSYIFQRHGNFGLVGGPFSGELWLDYDGEIMTINYESDKETRLRTELTESIKAQSHPSVRDWIENEIVCRSKNLLIRIDSTDKGLRYASWSKGRTIADKPDLILYNGNRESQGTLGGWTWTFTNGKWTYIIDDNEGLDGVSNVGDVFLRLLFDGKEHSSTKMRKSKQ